MSARETARRNEGASRLTRPALSSSDYRSRSLCGRGPRDPIGGRSQARHPPLLLRHLDGMPSASTTVKAIATLAREARTGSWQSSRPAAALADARCLAEALARDCTAGDESDHAERGQRDARTRQVRRLDCLPFGFSPSQCAFRPDPSRTRKRGMQGMREPMNGHPMKRFSSNACRLRALSRRAEREART
jgi:hypothetical protein